MTTAAKKWLGTPRGAIVILIYPSYII